MHQEETERSLANQARIRTLLKKSYCLLKSQGSLTPSIKKDEIVMKN